MAQKCGFLKTLSFCTSIVSSYHMFDGRFRSFSCDSLCGVCSSLQQTKNIRYSMTDSEVSRATYSLCGLYSSLRQIQSKNEAHYNVLQGRRVLRGMN
ncbi:unnamed protein product [Sphenostylis stenocarpa]|uniref:Uncharacterized protein n=1 Tax=Sphenostylis stenocarpa TaxID=92480 RepID=A0AA86T6R1_9FABA|nr:unnamed protein product [Sphenostylis stenocarpa]